MPITTEVRRSGKQPSPTRHGRGRGHGKARRKLSSLSMNRGQPPRCLVLLKCRRQSGLCWTYSAPVRGATSSSLEVRTLVPLPVGAEVRVSGFVAGAGRATHPRTTHVSDCRRSEDGLFRLTLSFDGTPPSPASRTERT